MKKWFWRDDMAYFLSVYTVTLTWFALSIHFVHPITVRGNLSDMVVMKDLVNYVKPYVKSLQVGPRTVYRKSFKLTPEMAINNKVKELEPYLQDQEVTEVLELEGGDETTIIEFSRKAQKSINEKIRKASFEKNIKKYKEMRNKIKLALDRESVSKELKQTVTRTLDELIAKLAETQCPQESLQNNEFRKAFSYRKNYLVDLISNINIQSDTCSIGNVKLNKKQCEILKHGFIHCKVNDKELNEKECKEFLVKSLEGYDCYNDKNVSIQECKKLLNASTMLINITLKNLTAESKDLKKYLDDTKRKFDNDTKSFQDFVQRVLPWSNEEAAGFYNDFSTTVKNVLKDSDHIPENYEVRCRLVDVEKERKGISLRSKDECSDVRICSAELKEFLLVFYKSINDSVVSTLKNYAAMYDKDVVAEDSEEKKTVIDIIYKISDQAESKIDKVFTKSMNKMTLDYKKDRTANVKALQQYVSDTIKLVNKTIVNHFEDDLKSLKARLFIAIKDDLQHNLAKDLDFIEKDLMKQMCSFFITCKGSLAFRKRTHKNSFRAKNLSKKNSNSVFVNLELKIDNELRKSILDLSKRKGLLGKYAVDLRRQFRDEFNKSNSNIEVTRTSIAVPTTTHNIDTTAIEESSDEIGFELDLINNVKTTNL